MNSPFSQKQLDVLVSDPLNFMILVGVTGSGKTFIANLWFLNAFLTAPKDSLCMISGNTNESVYDNVISDLLKLDNKNDLEYKSVNGRNRLISKKNNAQCVVVGANTENAQDRIFGKSIWIWYADEIQKQPQSFIELAVSRCRHVVNDNLIETYRIATLNPDNSNHIIKKKYIDNIKNLNGKVWVFNFEDNPKIADPAAHRKSLEKKMTGILRDRLVYGQWSSTEGAIIPEFSVNENDIVRENPRPDYFDIYSALDPGSTNYSAYVTGYYDFMNGLYVVENEFFFNNPNSKEIADAIKKCESDVFGDKKPSMRVSDTDLILIADLNTLHKLDITKTKKDNLQAQINKVRILCQSKQLVIHPRCVNLIRQLENGVWNKAGDSFATDTEGSHFDMIAALIYFVRSINVLKNPFPLVKKELKSDDTFIDVDMLKNNREKSTMKEYAKTFASLRNAFNR